MAAEARLSTGTIVEMYRAIWRVTGRQQLVLIGLSVTVAALAAAPLRFQQLVVNSLVAHGDIGRVGWLCAGLLGIVLLSAALKFALNFRLSVLGESVVLLLRERLYANYVTDAGTGASDVPKRGTLVTMLAAEAESVGAFAGAAIAEPLMQVGTLVSVIAFILASQPWLGVLALGIVVPQAVIVVAIQRRINHRVRQRVQALRDASDRNSGRPIRSSSTSAGSIRTRKRAGSSVAPTREASRFRSSGFPRTTPGRSGTGTSLRHRLGSSRPAPC